MSGTGLKVNSSGHDQNHVSQAAGRLGAPLAGFSGPLWWTCAELISAVVQAKEHFKLDKHS